MGLAMSALPPSAAIVNAARQIDCADRKSFKRFECRFDPGHGPRSWRHSSPLLPSIPRVLSYMTTLVKRAAHIRMCSPSQTKSPSVPRRGSAVPFGKGQALVSPASRAMNAVVGGWELSSAIVLQSGQFFSLTYSGTSWLQNRNGGASRPDCTGANPYTGNSTWAWNNNALYRNRKSGV